MKVIGFANKFYTLWDVTNHSESNGNCHYEWSSFAYIQNISMDKATALAKYPEAELDESLHGRTQSFSTSRVLVWDNADTFRFGKYEGKRIADVCDVDYTAWYFDNCQCFDDAHYAYLQEFLSGYGYAFLPYEEGEARVYMLTPEQYKEHLERIAKEEAFKNALKTNAPIELTMLNNLDSEGWYYSASQSAEYKFTDFVECYYAGYRYCLPAINGKGKRVKNKTITITDYTCEVEDGTTYITVNKFSVNK